MLVKHIPLKFKPKTLKVFIWSDICASQLRSKFVFTLTTYFDKAIDVEWYYNKSDDGKGPMDGVVGTMKNVVFRKVKSGRIHPKNS